MNNFHLQILVLNYNWNGFEALLIDNCANFEEYIIIYLVTSIIKNKTPDKVQLK